MAEGGTPLSWTSKIQCRYYLHGVCREGGNCRYNHDKSAKPSTVCRYYLAGNCSYGASCRYDHVKPKAPIPKPDNQSKPQTLMKSRVPPPLIDAGKVQGHMTSLKKNGSITSPPVSSPRTPEDWVKANEFVPGQPHICSTIPASYAKAANIESYADPVIIPSEEILTVNGQPLCPYLAKGVCPYGEDCEYIHGDVCELCGSAVLHPEDEEQRAKHMKECMEEHERDMELSFAIARSKDKCCGICMDTILEKEPASERRFGILSHCNHIFCLACIRKWRGAKQFENKIVRACPECRVNSNFVTPSKYWVESEEEKRKLIDSYKTALSQKHCKYFKRGKGDCPFNDKCFYLHANPDGSLAAPKPFNRRRKQNADGVLDLIGRINLWDFLEERESRPLFLLELEDDLDLLLFDSMMGYLSEQDDDSDSDSSFHW